MTDFCAALIGQKFLGMVDRAERLRAISARTAVPEEVQRYLIEASRCHIFGQYLGCLCVCRAALEFALGDFLKRNGKASELKELAAQGRDGLWERIHLSQSLGRWKLKPTLDDLNEVRKWAGMALHQQPLEHQQLYDRSQDMTRTMCRTESEERSV